MCVSCIVVVCAQLWVVLRQGEALYPSYRKLYMAAKVPQCCKPCVVGTLSCVGERRAGVITDAAGHKDAYGLFLDVTMMKAWISEFLAAWTALGLDAVLCPPNALPAFTHGAAYVPGRVTAHMLYCTA